MMDEPTDGRTEEGTDRHTFLYRYGIAYENKKDKHMAHMRLRSGKEVRVKRQMRRDQAKHPK